MKSSNNLEDFYLSLETDFSQYYDAWFDHLNMISPIVYKRYMKNTVSRKDNFELLKGLGYNVTEYGYLPSTYRGLYECFDGEDLKVIHYDEYAHCGMGKSLETLFSPGNPGDFYTKYIVSSPRASSFRLLRIGLEIFYLHYTSNHEWMSNVGDVTITLLDKAWAKNVIPTPLLIPYDTPMMAIDFVEEWDTGTFYAVDYNVSPGINKTPIEKMYSGKEIVEMLKEWHRYDSKTK